MSSLQYTNVCNFMDRIGLDALPDKVDDFFPDHGNKFPPLLLCQHQKRDTQNASILNRHSTERINDKEVYNLSGIGDKQLGYSENIDVDSELKQINFRADKCFYQNFKVNPANQDNKLHLHREILLRDHLQNQRGRLIDPDYQPVECLIQSDEFPVCPDSKDCEKYHRVNYQFHNEQVVNYPCQKVWSNLTKRKNLQGSYTCQDLGQGECLDPNVRKG